MWNVFTKPTDHSYQTGTLSHNNLWCWENFTSFFQVRNFQPYLWILEWNLTILCDCYWKVFSFLVKNQPCQHYSLKKGVKNCRLYQLVLFLYQNKCFEWPGCYLSKSRVPGTDCKQSSVHWIYMVRCTCQKHTAWPELDKQSKYCLKLLGRGLYKR